MLQLVGETCVREVQHTRRHQRVLEGDVGLSTVLLEAHLHLKQQPVLPVVNLFHAPQGLLQVLDQLEDVVAAEPRLAQPVYPLPPVDCGVPLLFEGVCVLRLNHRVLRRQADLDVFQQHGHEEVDQHERRSEIKREKERERMAEKALDFAACIIQLHLVHRVQEIVPCRDLEKQSHAAGGGVEIFVHVQILWRILER